MPADLEPPLFGICNGDEIEYEDNPAIAQAKANLVAAEQIQQKRAKQRRLEREERKAQAEVERLRWEIEEVEREWRELKEAELGHLTCEKEQLEEERRVEQQCAAALHGSKRVAEQRQAVLVTSPPEAGPSQAPPQKPEWTAKGVDWGPGIVIPEKNCAQCIAVPVGPRGTYMELLTMSTTQKTMFEVLLEKGKWRAEDEGEGVGPSKRPRVGPLSERMEWRQMEVGDPQVGSQVVEALWALNACLGEIQAELVTSQEAMSESTWLLRQSMVYNLCQIEMTLAVWRDQSQEEGEPEVEGSGEAEELGGQVEEQAE